MRSRTEVFGDFKQTLIASNVDWKENLLAQIISNQKLQLEVSLDNRDVLMCIEQRVEK